MEIIATPIYEHQDALSRMLSEPVPAPPKVIDPQDMSAESCAARGAALLDEQHPGWADKIDVDTLFMSDACHCICGQVFKEYEGAPKPEEHQGGYSTYSYDSGFDYAVNTMGRGFNVPNPSASWSSYYGFDTGGHCSWVSLTDAWMSEIKSRVS